MHQRNNPSITKMFAGFRMGRKKIGNKIKSIPKMQKPKLTKILFKRLEKLEILTQLQYNTVKEQLEKCTEKTDPTYISRLAALLEKFVPNKEEKNEKI